MNEIISPILVQTVLGRLSNEQRADLLECFRLIDCDGSGEIDASELGSALNLLGKGDTMIAQQPGLKAVSQGHSSKELD